MAGRFKLVRELGRGGMGAVWLAEHTGLDILCAIKLIDPRQRDSKELKARFEREAKAAAQLRSRNVVRILDYGVWRHVPYIAMEYLEGEDLGVRLQRVLRLSPAATFEIVAQVARALTKAHAAGIVHRDLKPENIFMVVEDDVELAKVLDFGIATRPDLRLEDGQTKTGNLVGTPFYMSPEQARGTKVDHRSDLWSLGVVAYECLTGSRPFVGEGLGDVIGKVIYEAQPTPSKIATDLPPSFDEWWFRAVARDADDRFQSADELTEALALALRVNQTLSALRLSSPSLSGAAIPSALTPAGSTELPVIVSPPPMGQEERNAPTILDEPAPSVADGQTGDPMMSTLAPVPAERRSHLTGVIAGVGATVVVGAIGFTAYLALRSTPTSEAAASPIGERSLPVEEAEPEPTAAPEVDAPKPSASAKPKAATPAAPPARVAPKPAPPPRKPAPRPPKEKKPVKEAPIDFGI